MEDYIIDTNGNKRDKRTGQLIGANKVETITNPQPYSPGSMATEEDYKKQSGWEKAKDWLQKHYSEENGKPLHDFGIESAREAKKDGALSNTINDALNKATEGIGDIANTPENNQMGGTESFGKPTEQPIEPIVEAQTPDVNVPVEQPEVKTEISDVEKLGNDVTETKETENSEDDSSDDSDDTENDKNPRDYSEYYSDFDELINKYSGPKNAAEYLKELWGNGAGGPAAAIGSVLGNLMSSLKWEGKGGEGGDWKKYQENYLAEQNRRNQEAFNQNMDIIKQARDADVSLDNTGKMIDYYEKLGDGDNAAKMAKIRKAMAMAGKTGWTDYAVSSLVGEFAQDKDFINSVKKAAKQGVNGATKILGFLSNIASPLDK